MRRIIVWGFTFVLFTTFVFGAELERYSGQSEDDGQESASNGYVNTSFGYVELRPDLDRWGGAYRFPNVTIPQGATINSAYLILACYVEIFRYPVVLIACEDVDSATVISSGSGSYDISSRWSNRTDAAVLWIDTVNWGQAARDSTPDLSALVQEIVNRPNWKTGNAIIFLFKCTTVGADSSYYETYSWDADPDSVYYGGILQVNYTPSGASNDPPIVSDIRDSTTAEGESFDPINLDDYVTDPDDHDSVMIWSHWGEVELLVDITDRVATIAVPDSEWNGSETIWFKACDPGGLCDSNEATFTVTTFNDTPMVSNIPDQIIAENDSFASIHLDDYVEDPDNPDGDMIWTHWGEVELLVDITDRVATIAVPDSEWNGSETIWFKACDPGGLCDSNEATFTVTTFNDTPMVSNIPDQIIAENDSFASIHLDDYVEDPDNPDGDMIWPHWGEVELLVDITDRVVTIAVPDSEWNGSESIWFKACDPGGLCDSNEATFTLLGSGFADEDTLLLSSAEFLLDQNCPNPFNLKTNISYSLPVASKIRLTIYDLLGKRVRTLVDEYQTPGYKFYEWDGTDDKGNIVASGIYFYRLEAEPFTETKKMLLLK